ncbi:MAG TPA: hypothetical protein VFE78_24120 [Gemmataceae bacterium]|jgi:hypothetical protein|nr:hypothetical protein [Gemmataceae bacterium]
MSLLRSLNRPRLAGAALALVLSASAVGCGGGRGEVRGTVRYRGRPLTSGTVQLLGADGVPYAATIGADGSYVVRAPVGAAKVIVSCLAEARLPRLTRQQPAGRSAVRGAAPPRPRSGGFSLVPERYGDWGLSGLAVEVGRGETTCDFDLRD